MLLFRVTLIIGVLNESSPLHYNKWIFSEANVIKIISRIHQSKRGKRSYISVKAHSISVFLLLLPYLNGLIRGKIFPEDTVGRRFSVEANAGGTQYRWYQLRNSRGFWRKIICCDVLWELTSQNGAFHQAGRVCGFDVIFVIFDSSEYKFLRLN